MASKLDIERIVNEPTQWARFIEEVRFSEWHFVEIVEVLEYLRDRIGVDEVRKVARP